MNKEKWADNIKPYGFFLKKIAVKNEYVYLFLKKILHPIFLFRGWRAFFFSFFSFK